MSALLEKALIRHRFCAENFIYYRIPKAANSTVCLSLAKAMGYDFPNTAKGAKQATRLGNNPVRPWRRYFRFTFVRDPYARALSVYLDKVQPPDGQLRPNLDLGSEPISFREFLERLAQGYLTANIHWLPQADILPERLDFIGRVETLDRDLPYVLSCVFGSAEISSATFHQTNASMMLDAFMGPAEKALTRQLYAKDFERFYAGAQDAAAMTSLPVSAAQSTPTDSAALPVVKFSWPQTIV